jgi:hypothetical protein
LPAALRHLRRCGGSNGTVDLNDASASVNGGGDTVNISSGYGNVVSLSNTGGNADDVNVTGYCGEVDLNNANATFGGGIQTIRPSPYSKDRTACISGPPKRARLTASGIPMRPSAYRRGWMSISLRSRWAHPFKMIQDHLWPHHPIEECRAHFAGLVGMGADHSKTFPSSIMWRLSSAV